MFIIRNYFTVAFRTLLKSKAQTLINIAGLSVGVACSLLILVWVENELSTDAWHDNGDRLKQVYERVYSDYKVEGNYGTPALLASEMEKTIPEVQYATAAAYDKWHTFQLGERIITLNGGYAGENYFKMFSNKLLEGDAQTALSSPSGIAISHKMADLFFGSSQAAMGKSIRYDNKRDFMVTAVFEDLPNNTSRKFEYLITLNEQLEEHPWLKGWDTQGLEAYLLLRPDANPEYVEKKVRHFLDKFNKDAPSFKVELGLQTYKDVYLHGRFANGKIEGGRIEYVKMFVLIAAFILLIACINFMNLATARSVKRAKEIGVRKVIGASRAGLIKQFIGESLLVTIISVLMALGLLVLLLPAFSQVTQKQLDLPFGHVSFWIMLLILTVVTGFISGSYPALFLSSFNPVEVLSGVLKLGRGPALFRKGLVVFQFVLSIILIIGTIVIARQINYIQSRNLGYDRENLIYMPLTGNLKGKFELFKDQVLNMPGIQAVSHTSEALTDIENAETDVQWAGKDLNEKIPFTIMSAGYDFIDIMKLKLLAGRDHSKDFKTDSSGFLINEAAWKKIGYADPIGRPLALWGQKGSIIGLIKDFHFTSLHDPIKPLIIRFGEYESTGSALVRTRSGMTLQALASLEAVTRQLNPNFPFNYTFSDEEYKNLYQNEQMIGRLSTSFSFLAIFISCLGLLGQIMFIAEQRIKEIGIRKLLGASVTSLFKLLSGEFLKLILIALLIASPISYFALNRWLQGFAYHTTIEWWIFLMAGAVIMPIAFLTISYQSLKTALMNPVDSLRSE